MIVIIDSIFSLKQDKNDKIMFSMTHQGVTSWGEIYRLGTEVTYLFEVWVVRMLE